MELNPTGINTVHAPLKLPLLPSVSLCPTVLSRHACVSHLIRIDLNITGERSFWRFPISGYAEGGNLDDIVSSVAPFYGLDLLYSNESCADGDDEGSSGCDAPYTVRVFTKQLIK